MAVHAGAFCAWLAAASCEAFLAEAAPERSRALARRWAPGFMLLCLAAGSLSAYLSLPFYREQTWLWLKLVPAVAAALVTALRAGGRLRPRPALWSLAALSGLALVLSFTRPF